MVRWSLEKLGLPVQHKKVYIDFVHWPDLRLLVGLEGFRQTYLGAWGVESPERKGSYIAPGVYDDHPKHNVTVSATTAPILHIHKARQNQCKSNMVPEASN